MLSFLIFSATSIFTPNDIFNNEWDIRVGTIQSFELPIPYSLEFHLNQTSQRTISTLWRNGDVATEYLKPTEDPLLAQFELSFNSENEISGKSNFAVGQFQGKIFISNEEIPYKFTELEDGNLATQIQYAAKNICISILIHSNETVSFTIKPINGKEETDHQLNYVAFRPASLNHVEIQKIFKDHDEIKKEMQTLKQESINWSSPSSVFKFANLYAKQFYRQYKHFIVFVLIVVGLQVFSFAVISFLKRLCMRNENTEDEHRKEIQARKKKDDDYEEEEKEGVKDDDEQQTEEEEQKE